MAKTKATPPGDEKKKTPSPKRITDLKEYLSRKQAFDDSTSTYQNSIDNHNKLLKVGLTKTKSTPASKDEQDEMLVEGEEMNNFTHTYTDPATGKTVKKTAKMYQKTSGKIAPVKSNTYTGKALVDKDGISYQQETTIPIYKAPKEVVEYAPDITPEIKPKEVVIETPKESTVGKRTSGGNFQRVASINKKYANQREYSTYKKNEGPLVEDKYKRDVINRRKAILEKNSKKDNKK